MTPFVQVVMFGWIPFVIGLFLALPSRIAVIAAFVLGWLFLPVAGFAIEGFIDYNKVTAINIAVLLCAGLLDTRRFLALRPSWVDVPIAVFCLTPFFSSIANGLGPYDGASAALSWLIMWGAPYLLGRAYFADLAGQKLLAIGIVLGGIVYIPLCLYEARLSPQLHNLFYGYHQHKFIQTIRGDTYRPMVFMFHGLMVAMWMAAGTLAAFWMWSTGALRRLLWLPMWCWAGLLLFTTVACKSLGAVALLMGGLGALFFTKWTRMRIALAAVVLAAPTYMAMRTVGGWSGAELVQFAGMVSGDRAASIQFRLDNENMLVEKAFERPMFGWAGWGRSRVTDDRGDDISTTDGMWVIAFGNFGLVGLASQTLVLLLPPLLLLWRCPAEQWGSRVFAPAAALATLLALYQVDCLFNAMLNPIYVVVAGGVGGLALRARKGVGAPVSAAATGARPHLPARSRRRVEAAA